MLTLHLTLKKKWFDMIASGEKKEEYREIKPYWVSRIVDEIRIEAVERHDSFLVHGAHCTINTTIYYDAVKFTNGYSKSSPTITVEIVGIETGIGKEKWGAPIGQHVFIIKLGKILTA